MSFMSKFLVQGRDAGKVLNFLSTAQVDGPKETIVYTQWLNSFGKLEADLTVTKIDDQTFFVVATDTAHRHVETLVKRQIEDMDAHAFLTDVSGGYAQINIQGPRSRELLQMLTPTDLTNEAYPFRTARKIEIGYSWTLCTRITYVGELGYELFIPTEQAVHVYNEIMEAEGRGKFGLTHSGLRALSSLRHEKFYRDYGHDLDNTDTVIEAGLSFTCDFEKEGGFKGKEHVLREKEEKSAQRRLATVLVKDPLPLLYHGEVIYRDGKVVGNIRSSSYGFSVGGAIGIAMIDAGKGERVNKSFLEQGKWEIEIGNKKYPVHVSLKPLYDPSNSKIKK